MPDPSKALHWSRVSFYAVDGDAAVHLRAWVGQGQPGGIAVYLDDNLLSQGPEPVDAILGQGETLRGKLLTVVITSTADNPTSLRCGGRVELTGGTGTRTIAVAEEVESAGQMAILTVMVNLL